MITYTATKPDGSVHTHSSSRIYTHAIAGYNTATNIWYVNAYCGNLALAEKRLRRLNKFYKADFILLELKASK